jgi:KRAB domain-containing zinc finger protein
MNIKNIKILLLIGMYISGCNSVDKIEKDKNKMSAYLNTSRVTTCDELSQRIIEKEVQKSKKKKNFMCSYPGCGKIFSYQSRFDKHMRVHTGEKPYRCKVCGKDFADKYSFVLHEKMHKGEKPHVCKYEGCTYSSIKKSHLDVHERTHTGEKPHVCKYEGCTYSSVQKSNLDVHERTHTGEKPYRCEECNKGFARKDCLIKHMKIHTGEKPYECNLCNKKFTDCKGLNYHTRNRVCEQNKKQNFICSYLGCGKLFSCQSKLDMHMRIHTDENLYKCNLCNKKFTYSSSLAYHTKNRVCEQKKKNNFMCSYPGCDKFFSHQSQLDMHTRIHTGKKLHVCRYEGCTYSSDRKGNLDRHERIHMGEKPYRCDECNKVFSRKDHLMSHMKIHTNKKK